MQSCHNCSGGPELLQVPRGHLPQLAKPGLGDQSRAQGEAQFPLHCPQPSSFSLGHHFYSPTTVSSPAQAAEPKPAPASFLTAPFSHSRSHVLWQQAAPPH